MLFLSTMLDGELRLCAAVMNLAVKHLEAPFPEPREIESRRRGSRQITERELEEERRVFRQAYLSAARFFLAEGSSSFEWMAFAVRGDIQVMRQRISRILVARHRSHPDFFEFSLPEVALAERRIALNRR